MNQFPRLSPKSQPVIFPPQQHPSSQTLALQPLALSFHHEPTGSRAQISPIRANIRAALLSTLANKFKVSFADVAQFAGNALNYGDFSLVLQSMKEQGELKYFLLASKQIGGGYQGNVVYHLKMTTPEYASVSCYIVTQLSVPYFSLITDAEEVQSLNQRFGLKGGDGLLEELVNAINQGNKAAIDARVAALNLSQTSLHEISAVILHLEHYQDNNAASYTVASLRNQLALLTPYASYNSSQLIQSARLANSTQVEGDFSLLSRSTSLIQQLITESENSPMRCNVLLIAELLQANLPLVFSGCGNWTVGEQLMFNAYYNQNLQLFHVLRYVGVDFKHMPSSGVANPEQIALWLFESELTRQPPVTDLLTNLAQQSSGILSAPSRWFDHPQLGSIIQHQHLSIAQVTQLQAYLLKSPSLMFVLPEEVRFMVQEVSNRCSSPLAVTSWLLDSELNAENKSFGNIKHLVETLLSQNREALLDNRNYFMPRIILALLECYPKSQNIVKEFYHNLINAGLLQANELLICLNQYYSVGAPRYQKLATNAHELLAEPQATDPLLAAPHQLAPALSGPLIASAFPVDIIAATNPPLSDFHALLLDLDAFENEPNREQWEILRLHCQAQVRVLPLNFDELSQVMMKLYQQYSQHRNSLSWQEEASDPAEQAELSREQRLLAVNNWQFSSKISRLSFNLGAAVFKRLETFPQQLALYDVVGPQEAVASWGQLGQNLVRSRVLHNPQFSVELPLLPPPVRVRFSPQLKVALIARAGEANIGLLQPVTTMFDEEANLYSASHQKKGLLFAHLEHYQVKYFKAIRGDGNCFYRAVMSEYVLQAGAQGKIDDLLELIKSCPLDLEEHVIFELDSLFATQKPNLAAVFIQVMTTYVQLLQSRHPQALLYIVQQQQENVIFDLALNCALLRFLLCQEILGNPNRTLNGINYATAAIPDLMEDPEEEDYSLQRYSTKFLKKLGVDAQGFPRELVNGRILPGVRTTLISYKPNSSNPNDIVCEQKLDQPAVLQAWSDGNQSFCQPTVIKLSADELASLLGDPTARRAFAVSHDLWLGAERVIFLQVAGELHVVQLYPAELHRLLPTSSDLQLVPWLEHHTQAGIIQIPSHELEKQFSNYRRPQLNCIIFHQGAHYSSLVSSSIEETAEANGFIFPVAQNPQVEYSDSSLVLGPELPAVEPIQSEVEQPTNLTRATLLEVLHNLQHNRQLDVLTEIVMIRSMAQFNALAASSNSKQLALIHAKFQEFIRLLRPASEGTSWEFSASAAGEAQLQAELITRLQSRYPQLGERIYANYKQLLRAVDKGELERYWSEAQKALPLVSRKESRITTEAKIVRLSESVDIGRDNLAQEHVLLESSRLSRSVEFASDPLIVAELKRFIVGGRLDNSTKLRELAIKLIEYKADPHVLEMLAEIGLRLVFLEPDKLASYQQLTSYETRIAMMPLLRTPFQFNKLLYEDQLYGGYIGMEDLLINPSLTAVKDPHLSNLSCISGASAITFYAISLENDLRDKPNIDLEFITHSSINFDGSTKILHLPIVSNGSEQLLRQVLSSPYNPPYLLELLNKLLPALDLNVIALNQAQVWVRQGGAEDTHLEDELASDCRELPDLYEVMQLILRYTRYSSKNKSLGGKGEEYAAHPEWAYKMQRLLYVFWTEWCDDGLRKELLNSTSGMMQNFFIVATQHGKLFAQYERKKYFTNYVEDRNVLQCTDLAQGHLNQVLTSEAPIRLLRAKRNIYSYPKVERSVGVAALARAVVKSKQELAGLVQILRDPDLTSKLTVGCHVMERNGGLVLININQAIASGDLSLLQQVVAAGTEINPTVCKFADDLLLSAEITRFIFNNSTYRGKGLRVILEEHSAWVSPLPRLILREAILGYSVNDPAKLVDLFKEFAKKEAGDVRLFLLLLPRIDPPLLSEFFKRHLVKVLLATKDYPRFQVALVLAILANAVPTEVERILRDQEQLDVKNLAELEHYFSPRSKRILLNERTALELVECGLSKLIYSQDSAPLEKAKLTIQGAVQHILEHLRGRSVILKKSKASLQHKIERFAELIVELNVLDLQSPFAKAQLIDLDYRIRTVLQTQRAAVGLFKRSSSTSLEIYHAATAEIKFNELALHEIYYDNPAARYPTLALYRYVPVPPRLEVVELAAQLPANPPPIQTVNESLRQQESSESLGWQTLENLQSLMQIHAMRNEMMASNFTFLSQAGVINRIKAEYLGQREVFIETLIMRFMCCFNPQQHLIMRSQALQLLPFAPARDELKIASELLLLAQHLDSEIVEILRGILNASCINGNSGDLCRASGAVLSRVDDSSSIPFTLTAIQSDRAQVVRAWELLASRLSTHKNEFVDLQINGLEMTKDGVVYLNHHPANWVYLAGSLYLNGKLAEAKHSQFLQVLRDGFDPKLGMLFNNNRPINDYGAYVHYDGSYYLNGDLIGQYTGELEQCAPAGIGVLTLPNGKQTKAFFLRGRMVAESSQSL